MEVDPVPLWFRKSPPWAMNWGMMRWKVELQYPADDDDDDDDDDADFAVR